MTYPDPLCCAGLRFAIEDAGIGLSVVARNPDKPFLSLFAASKDRSFVTSTGMRFCPFCGRDIDDLIAAERDYFVELAKKHAPLLPPGW